MCAGLYNGRDSCEGDSGCPLMYRASVEGAEKYFLVGVVSFGSNCSITAPLPLPGVYTRVTYYLPWIIRNMV